MHMTWTRAVNLVRDHAALRDVLGAAPSDDAAYRFTKKLREHNATLTSCIEETLTALHGVKPEMGQTVAIDGSDLPAYANRHKHVGNKNGPLRTRFADPDAGWGHRSSISTRKGGAYYGYKFTPRSAPPRTCRWPGPWRRRTSPSRSRCRASWTPRCGAASPRAWPYWTRV